MEFISKLVPLILIIMSVFLFLSLLRRGGKLDAEQNETPVFEEICGARLGFANYSRPFARHSIYRDFIVISAHQNRYLIDLSKIESVRSHRGLLSQGIKYAHSQGNAPKNIIIWTHKGSEIIALIKRLQDNKRRMNID